MNQISSPSFCHVKGAAFERIRREIGITCYRTPREFLSKDHWCCRDVNFSNLAEQLPESKFRVSNLGVETLRSVQLSSEMLYLPWVLCKDVFFRLARQRRLFRAGPVRPLTAYVDSLKLSQHILWCDQLCRSISFLVCHRQRRRQGRYLELSSPS